MKIIKLFLILLVFASCKNETKFLKTPIVQSEIDRLKSKSEIEKFIQKSDTNYKKYELKNLQNFNRSNRRDSINKILANKLNVKTNYTKVDFDNNGYTDLLAIGDNHDCISFRPGIEGEESCSFSPIVVMNYGENKTKIFHIDKEWGNSIVPKVEHINSQPFLVIYTQKLVDGKKNEYAESKNILTFKFGDFIEYNENPKKNKITRIEFSTSGCFGSCPVYKLTLNRNSLSVFNARYYNFNKEQEVGYGKEEGVFSAKINKTEFDKLEELINYCDFENLNKEYYVMHTDDQTGNLKITFNNGKVKTISDYGMIGTYGLKKLYDKLAEIRFSQKWKKN
ncbi:DUF6438 domain-containing protein [Flavobacterium pectinovorum]|uniref:DUF6438 domain-containing protein n=1 Tax=Flavobacterium pectinovorum TaxID=29533 RepID=A0A502ESA4_9FLAO|nr:DUF6438 domain-containing protein [Flavobacterium pectinovorum]TPG39942.1 hypothetical protein EAH81_11620 [Flavobacterium pectinovorum]